MSSTLKNSVFELRAVDGGTSRLSFLHALTQTSGRFAPLLLRLLLAAVIFPHGAQKVLGWYGGEGLESAMGFFVGMLGVPTVFAAVAIAIEFVAPLGLFLGLFTRFAAFAIGVTMAVAAFMVHAPNGFFMNWSGKQPGEGFEYHLLALGISLALMIEGGGRWSFDSLLSRATNRR